ncbi:hypothetical protein HMI54_010642 [Coelomomyces lativittatus]|nr:hypothetical protein HMI54_010642 [Coelomomyces lativittatus]
MRNEEMEKDQQRLKERNSLDQTLSQSLPSQSKKPNIKKDNPSFSTSYPPSSSTNNSRPPTSKPEDVPKQSDLDLEDLLLMEAMRLSLLSLHPGN